MRATKCRSRCRGVSVAAVLLGALLAILFIRETPLSADDAAKAPPLPPDLAKIPSDAVVVLSWRIADFWNSDLGESIRRNLGKEAGKEKDAFEKQFDLPLEQVDRMTFVARRGVGRVQPLQPSFFVRTIEAYDRDKVIAAGKSKEEKYKGQTFYVKGKHSVYPLDARSLVYGSANNIRALIDHSVQSDGYLAGVVRLAAGKHSLVLGLDVKDFNDQVGARLPAEPFRPLLHALYGTLTADLGAESRAEVKLSFAGEKEAKAALKPANSGVALARAALESASASLSKQKDTSKIVETLKLFQGALKAARIEQDGKTLQVSARLKVDVVKTGHLLAEAMRKVRAATAREQAANNFRQIAFAMRNYRDTNGRLPPQAVYDKSGKAMLSWRVLVLPYMDEQDLYKQFHLDEPWDSAHNKKLLAKMPEVYASPKEEKTKKDHTTHYQVFFGKSAVFEGKKGTQNIDITDDISHTIMVVEATKAVPWSKPEDIAYDAAKPLPKLGLPGANGFWAGFCDGIAHFISHSAKAKALHALITRNGGEDVDVNDL